MINEYESLKERVFSKIELNVEELIALNNNLADNPETSGEEFKSSKKIVELLREHSFDVEYPFAGIETAFRGNFGEQNHSRKIAIMVEYDALPEIGHACGHCTSGAISLLAGIALKDFQDALDTDIHLVGTPIEETDGAKATMVKKGVFDGYNMAIMLHMYDSNIVAPNSLALDSFLYSFHVKAAHASSAPWDGINAFNAAQLMIHGIDMMRQHVTPDVRLHGIIRYGGEAPNIVPELCTAEVYTRALERLRVMLVWFALPSMELFNFLIKALQFTLKPLPKELKDHVQMKLLKKVPK